MNSIIRSEVEKTIDIRKLRNMVPEYCAVKRYDQLRGKTLKDVMGKYTVLIILWNIHDKKHRTLNDGVVHIGRQMRILLLLDISKIFPKDGYQGAS